MRLPMLLLVAAFGGAECERTPPEDFPSRATAPAPAAPPVASTPTIVASAAVGASVSGRCVRPTPPSPPRSVPPGPAPGCPADPERGPGKLPIVRIAFPDAAGAAVDAELVSAEHDTMRGLMYRTSMPEDHGMLFNLHVRDDHKFWMHNTCIPLDLMYVDEDGLVVGIVENAPTLDDTSRGVDCPSLYVLEVNAGWARRHGVKAGLHMTVPPSVR
jgi:uncharacterized protein